MIIDSKGRLFGKISIIDILVVLILVGGVAGIGYKFTKSGKANPFTKADNIVMQFYHQEQNEFAVRSIKEGTPVKDLKTNAYIGTVKHVEIKPSNSTAADDKGQYQASARPGFVSVVITVEGTGIYRDGINGQGVSFSGTDYYINKSTELALGNTDLWTFVYSITKKE